MELFEEERLMMMRKDEIRESYRTAKSKKRQIGILAELNAVSEDYIKEILIEGGELKKAGRKSKEDRKPEEAIQNDHPVTEKPKKLVATVKKETPKITLPSEVRDALMYSLQLLDEKIKAREACLSEYAKTVMELKERRNAIAKYVED